MCYVVSAVVRAEGVLESGQEIRCVIGDSRPDRKLGAALSI
jgi:hypothetical protein